ncbi:aldo/keto reductase [Pasteurellaceae bacterium RH1A]|nr:aldo/keto reductase [Pasteurellaceae bacterium RH1A]
MNNSRRNLLKAGGLTALGLGLNAVAFAKTSSNPTALSTENHTKLPSQRQLGKLTISSLGLGCQGFGQNMYGVAEPSKEQSIKIIRQAFDHGITFFDTAEAYGPFKSERVVGEAIKPFRKQITLATKFGWDIDQQTGQRTGKVNSKPEHIKRVVDNMLTRLQTDYIDLLYQHRADPDVPVEDVVGTVQELIKAGKVRGYGLCEVSPATIRKAHAIEPMTAVQSEYSLLFRGREKDVLPVCKELGIGFVPWSPLGMGVLGGYVSANQNFGDNPAMDLRGILPRFESANWQHNFALIELIRKWSFAKLCTPAQLSLAWLQAQGDFIVPIPGTTKSNHLMDNLGADGVSFTADELAQFTRELDQIQIQGDRLPEAILKFSEVR